MDGDAVQRFTSLLRGTGVLALALGAVKLIVAVWAAAMGLDPRMVEGFLGSSATGKSVTDSAAVILLVVLAGVLLGALRRLRPARRGAFAAA
jgi:hypothetical protein